MWDEWATIAWRVSTARRQGTTGRSSPCSILVVLTYSLFGRRDRVARRPSVEDDGGPERPASARLVSASRAHLGGAARLDHWYETAPKLHIQPVERTRTPSFDPVIFDSSDVMKFAFFFLFFFFQVGGRRTVVR